MKLYGRILAAFALLCCSPLQADITTSVQAKLNDAAAQVKHTGTSQTATHDPDPSPFYVTARATLGQAVCELRADDQLFSDSFQNRIVFDNETVDVDHRCYASGESGSTHRVQNGGVAEGLFHIGIQADEDQEFSIAATGSMKVGSLRFDYTLSNGVFHYLLWDGNNLAGAGDISGDQFLGKTYWNINVDGTFLALAGNIILMESKVDAITTPGNGLAGHELYFEASANLK